MPRPTLAQLEEQLVKAEAAKQAATERYTNLEKRIKERKQQDRIKLERTIGKLAIEAGLGEWSEQDLLAGFERLAAGLTVETAPAETAAD